jgi:hypothetical protein
MAIQTIPSPPNSPESDIAAWTGGIGMVLIQACALFPGLLPCLLLLLPLAVPLLVLGAVIGIPYLLFRTAWRLLASAARLLEGSSHSGAPTRQGSETQPREAF